MMKKIKLLFFFTVFNLPLIAQTNCDSLEINCCNFQLLSNDTISLQVQNSALQEIFDYPGFLILAENGDTIAKETVNFFGIGFGWQTHYLAVQNLISVPFSGTLQLHGLFYDTMYCEFPLMISSLSLDEQTSEISVHPNPAVNQLTIDGVTSSNYAIFNLSGEKVKSGIFQNSTIDLNELPSGGYIIEFTDDFIVFRNKLKFLKL